MIITQSYNLGRLGNAGDVVRFEADAEQRAAIAAQAEALSLARFAVTVQLAKVSSSRFKLDYRLEAEITQACVVTLDPVLSRIDRSFVRELHFVAPGRKAPEPAAELDLSGQEEDEPEEIDNLHYDLAGPALEEFLLALDPYPRCPGVEFDPGQVGDPAPESPLAVLKSLKSRT